MRHPIQPRRKKQKQRKQQKPADGEYETSAEATGSMFRVISSRLIVKDGKLKSIHSAEWNRL